MSEPKTKPTNASPADFIARVAHPIRRRDAETALAMLSEVTGAPAVMWGASIVGFGQYLTTGAKPTPWPMIGFSPRKAEMVVYVMPGFSEYDDLLARLGPHRTGASCLYIKDFAKADMSVLRELAERSYAMMRAKYRV